MKTLLLGLDGMDPDLIERWDLPNIKGIGETFEIDTHGNSGPSWASVMTGLKPKYHGIRKLEPQLDSQAWQGEPIWQKINGYSGVANVPMTYPPQNLDIDGWLVSSMFTPAKSIYTNPPDLYRDLEKLGYKIDIWVDDHKNHPHGHYGTVPFEFTQEFREEALEKLRGVMKSRCKGFKWLLTEYTPVDFAFLVFTALDRVQHMAMDDMAEIESFYKLQDELVGDLLSTIPDDTEVFMVSDHGFQRIDLPDTDIVGEHRREGFGATNTGETFQNLEQLHSNVVESANRAPGVERKLKDLGYIQ